jgi:uncharacterized protein YijF (DUF1287 family)
VWARPSCAEGVVEAARAQIGRTIRYDPAYRVLDYPGGDVPIEVGVCTDVVIRAWRRIGLDLQRLVHEDMRTDFAAYPRLWGLVRPDRNIDHRRVPNLEAFFDRQGLRMTPSERAADFRAGDVVSWRLPDGRPHIGIVDHASVGDRRLIIHNIGAGTRAEDVLFAWPIHRHYRLSGPLLSTAGCSNDP